MIEMFQNIVKDVLFVFSQTVLLWSKYISTRMRSVGFIPPSPASEVQYEAISEDVMITRNDYRMQTLLRLSYG